MALDKQFCVYGIDTSAFYFDEERNIEQRMYKLRAAKSGYKEILKDSSLNEAIKFVIEKKYKEVSIAL